MSESGGGALAKLIVRDARRVLDDLEQRYKDGSPAAVLDAVRTCAAAGLPLPPWAAMAFIGQHDTARRHLVKSWDDVFGKPLEAGKHLASARKRREIEHWIWMEVEERKNQGESVTEVLFEEVGARHGVQKTLAADIYYECRQKWGTSAKP